VDQSAHQFLADRRAVVNRPLVLFFSVPRVDIGCAGLEIHARGDTVEDDETGGERFDRMTMRIDEARGDHVAGRVDAFLARDPFLGDDRDPAVPDADVGDLVAHRLRVHDAAMHDDQVIVRRNYRQRHDRCQD